MFKAKYKHCNFKIDKYKNNMIIVQEFTHHSFIDLFEQNTKNKDPEK